MLLWQVCWFGCDGSGTSDETLVILSGEKCTVLIVSWLDCKADIDTASRSQVNVILV